MAYTLDGENPAQRPLTFAFNGGPGASSVWLHLGALGPKLAALSCGKPVYLVVMLHGDGEKGQDMADLALGWAPGDVVIVPAITFLASANCAAYVGAEPYFVDVDDRTITIDPNRNGTSSRHWTSVTVVGSGGSALLHDTRLSKE